MSAMKEWYFDTHGHWFGEAPPEEPDAEEEV